MFWFLLGVMLNANVFQGEDFGKSSESFNGLYGNVVCNDRLLNNCTSSRLQSAATAAYQNGYLHVMMTAVVTAPEAKKIQDNESCLWVIEAALKGLNCEDYFVFAFNGCSAKCRRVLRGRCWL